MNYCVTDIIFLHPRIITLFFMYLLNNNECILLVCEFKIYDINRPILLPNCLSDYMKINTWSNNYEI